MKDFLTAEPGSRDEDETPTASTESPGTDPGDPWATPSEPAKNEDIVEAEVVETQAEPAKDEAPAAVADDDDLPF